MIAVVAGSSGLVGSLLIEKLLVEHSFTGIIALSRSPLKNPSPKLINIVCPNFDDLESVAHQLVGDVYFCCLGTTIKKAVTKENFKKIDLDAPTVFAKIAKSHNAKQFLLVSASGANPASTIFYNQVKGLAELKITELQLSNLVIFRPGLLIGERTELRPAEKISIRLLSLLSPIIPKTIENKISTKVEKLCEKMIEESKDNTHKVKIINASDI